MVDKEQTTEDAPAAPPAPRRGPGHRGADMRDTVAEMAERAQLISQEAGSKVSSAMKDVISAAAGLAGFAIESARDLVQYMVRRGQMTQEEADKLIREVEAALPKKKPVAAAHSPAKAGPSKPAHAPPPVRTAAVVSHKPAAAAKPAAKKAAPKKAAPKKPTHHKPAPKKPAAKKPAPKKSAPAKKAPKKGGSKKARK